MMDDEEVAVSHEEQDDMTAMESESLEDVEDLEEISAGPDDENVEELEELEPIDQDDAVRFLEVVSDSEAPIIELDRVQDEEVVGELETVEDDDGTVHPVLLIESSQMPFLSSSMSFGGQFVKPTGVSEEHTEQPVRTAFFRSDEIGSERVIIRGLENNISYQVVELDDFLTFAGKNQSIIDERNGIAQIQAAAYFVENPRVDVRIQNLADQIINHQTVGSIEDVMANAFDDMDFGDLFDADSSGSNQTVPAFGERSDTSLRLVSGGFALPHTGESGDAGVRQVYRELVGLTRRWDARVAVILESRQDGGVVGSFSLGMPSECPDPFKIPSDSDIFENVFAYRRVGLLKKKLGAFRDFEENCYARRLASINSWLLLPLSSDSGTYLMVGFARTFEDLLEISSRYEIASRAG